MLDQFITNLNKYLLRKRLIYRFETKRDLLSRYLVFKILKLNYLINTFILTKIMNDKKIIFDKLKDNCNYKIKSRISRMSNMNKIIAFRRKRMKNKMKLYFKIYRENKFKISLMVKAFKEFCLKAKIFKFLKEYYRKSTLLTINLAKNFRQVYLKYRFFYTLKRYRNIVSRENYILNTLEKNYEMKNYKLKSTVIDYLKKYYICEKFKRMKQLQMKIKIFYTLKFVLKK